MIQRMKCTHIFHNECLYKWFIMTREKPCPLCRKDADMHRYVGKIILNLFNLMGGFYNLPFLQKWTILIRRLSSYLSLSLIFVKIRILISTLLLIKLQNIDLLNLRFQKNMCISIYSIFKRIKSFEAQEMCSIKMK